MPPRSYLVADIETVLDPELPLADPAESERLPPPAHHQVVVIGLLWLDAKYGISRLGVVEGEAEADILETFSRFLDKHQPGLVTYNGRRFDLPVIAARSLRHGVALRYYYQSRDVRYRYTDEGHLDLFDFLGDFGAAQGTNLDVMSKLCGMPGKVGIEGKDVGPMVHAGRLEEVRNYCLCDVVQTAAVFLRSQLLRANITRDAYLDSVRGLLATIDADDRVAAVRAGINRPRLLLEER